MFLGVIFLLTAICALCWLLFNLAVYALPFFVGMSAGMWAYETGAGVFGAFIVGFVAGVAALIAFQVAMAFLRPIWARLAVALIFAAPAAIAGYHATLGLAELMMPSETWRVVFAVVGAIAVGVTALVRVSGVGTFSEASSA